MKLNPFVDITVLCIILSFCSCGNDDEMIVSDSLQTESGKTGSGADTTVFLRQTGDMVVFPMPGEGWYIDDITPDGYEVSISPANKSSVKAGRDAEFVCGWLMVKYSKGNLCLCATENASIYERSFHFELSNDSLTMHVNGIQKSVSSTESEDMIELSKKNVIFAPQGSSDTIITSHGDWWINRIIIDYDKVYELFDSEKNILLAGGEISHDWLTIKREDNLLILTANNGNYDNIEERTRFFCLHLQSDNGYFDLIDGIQPPLLTGSGWTDDVIGLSQDVVDFSEAGEVVVINTEKANWWLTSIVTDNAHVWQVNIDNDALMNGERKSYTCDWLTVEVHENEIKLTASPNETDSVRNFKVGLQVRGGNYYTSITGSQRGK